MHKTFGEFHRYPKLNPYEGLEGSIPLRYGDVFMGIEIETENTSQGLAYIPGSFKAIDDGSLKIYGKEFVTVPIKLMYLEKELERLFKAIPHASFSSRTSIHVHMNARDFTVQNMLDFTMLYTLFERDLYKYSGDRWSNNFCIPLRTSPTHLTKLMWWNSDKIDNRDNRLFDNDIEWSKYLGFNLSPLTGSYDQSKKYGTIEFRQMIGNNDIPFIINWCNLITCMKFYVKSLDSGKFRALIEANKGHEIVEDVFRQWTSLLFPKKDLTEVKEGNSFLKYCLEVNKYNQEGITPARAIPRIQDGIRDNNDFWYRRESHGELSDVVAGFGNVRRWDYNPFPSYIGDNMLLEQVHNTPRAGDVFIDSNLNNALSVSSWTSTQSTNANRNTLTLRELSEAFQRITEANERITNNRGEF